MRPVHSDTAHIVMSSSITPSQFQTNQCIRTAHTSKIIRRDNMDDLAVYRLRLLVRRVRPVPFRD